MTSRSATIRAWAKAAGYPVNERGAVPKNIVAEYELMVEGSEEQKAAHRDFLAKIQKLQEGEVMNESVEIGHALNRQLSVRPGWTSNDEGWESSDGKVRVTAVISVFIPDQDHPDGGKTLIFGDMDSYLTWLNKYEHQPRTWQPAGEPSLYVGTP